MWEDLSPMKILVILLVVVVLFGAKRLPEVGSSLGQGIREFKKSLGGLGDEPAAPPPPQAQAPSELGSVPTESGPKRLVE